MALTVAQYNRDNAQSFTLAAAGAVGELVGIDANGLLVLADANTTPVVAVGFLVSGGAIGARVAIATEGTVDGFSGLTPGGTIYTSGTAGGITQTRPATAGDAVQPVGWAISATAVRFHVTPSFAVIQAAGTSTLA